MQVVKRDFSQQVGAVFLTFQGGQVIENQRLEAELVASGAPVDVVEDAEDLVQCPHCRRKFTVKQAVDQEDE